MEWFWEGEEANKGHVHMKNIGPGSSKRDTLQPTFMYNLRPDMAAYIL